jgi:hypothetical protein
MKTQFPLDWPVGWRRTANQARRPDRFQYDLTLDDAARRVLRELLALGARESDVIISTNVRSRGDATPQREDPGVAVYWRYKGAANCMAADRYRRAEGNLAAIAATLNAMRAIERHGGAEVLNRAFAGFAALPPPEQHWRVLGLATSTPTPEEVEEAYRRLAMRLHPDRGGSEEAMAKINAARAALLEHRS